MGGAPNRIATLMRLVLTAAFLLATALTAHAGQSRLVEPTLHVPAGARTSAPRVALTLDACGGSTDTRILSALVDNAIPATIFATGIWLRQNPAAVEILKRHPELFEVENHGGHHVPAVDEPKSIYGIAAAGSSEAVMREVAEGAEALIRAGLPAPHWFRGATARYTPSAVASIERLGFRIAGYSVNADGGSLLGAAATEHQVKAARDGDVLIAHINKPTHAAGEGLVRGLLALKARGVQFVRLVDTEAAY